MECSRQDVVDVLRTAGLPEVAEEVSRSLPDPVDFERATKLLYRYGITKDVLISRMGGSP